MSMSIPGTWWEIELSSSLFPEILVVNCQANKAGEALEIVRRNYTRSLYKVEDIYQCGTIRGTIIK